MSPGSKPVCINVDGQKQKTIGEKVLKVVGSRSQLEEPPERTREFKKVRSTPRLGGRVVRRRVVGSRVKSRLPDDDNEERRVVSLG